VDGPPSEGLLVFELGVICPTCRHMEIAEPDLLLATEPTASLRNSPWWVALSPARFRQEALDQNERPGMLGSDAHGHGCASKGQA
jgi:hypothetical protein